jgi:hypothetical protein
LLKAAPLNRSIPGLLNYTEKIRLALSCTISICPILFWFSRRGQIWHWDVYVDRNNLWHHFKTFAESVKNINPSAEQFEPQMIPHPRLKVYCLKGKQLFLIWCRDSQNNWMTELRDEIAPENTPQSNNKS